MTTAIADRFAAPTVANLWPQASALTALRALDDATLRDLGVHV